MTSAKQVFTECLLSASPEGGAGNMGVNEMAVDLRDEGP